MVDNGEETMSETDNNGQGRSFIVRDRIEKLIENQRAYDTPPSVLLTRPETLLEERLTKLEAQIKELEDNQKMLHLKLVIAGKAMHIHEEFALKDNTGKFPDLKSKMVNDENEKI